MDIESRIKALVERVEKATGKKRIPGDGDGDGIPYESRNRKKTGLRGDTPNTKNVFDSRANSVRRRLDAVPVDQRRNDHSLATQSLDRARGQRDNNSALASSHLKLAEHFADRASAAGDAKAVARFGEKNVQRANFSLNHMVTSLNAGKNLTAGEVMAEIDRAKGLLQGQIKTDSSAKSTFEALGQARQFAQERGIFNPNHEFNSSERKGLVGLATGTHQYDKDGLVVPVSSKRSTKPSAAGQTAAPKNKTILDVLNTRDGKVDARNIKETISSLRGKKGDKILGNMLRNQLAEFKSTHGIEYPVGNVLRHN